MTIDQAYRLIQFVANKEQQGNIKPEDFNLLAPIAQLSVLNDRLGNVKKYRPHDPVPPYGVGITQKIDEELRPVLDFSTQSVNTGEIPYPDSAIYVHTVEDPSSKCILRPVTYDELRLAEKSVIKPPIASKGIYALYGGKIVVSPSSYTNIKVSFYRKPVTPVWNYTVVSGRPVYAATGGIIGDGNSHDFELSVTTHMEICMNILANVGVNLDTVALTQYAELQQQKGS